MMWSPAILLLLVGAAFASQQNGWKDGKEYTFKIRSRTLAVVDSQSKQYSGIMMKGFLTVQPNGKDTLRALVSKSRYSQIHTRLDNGWDSEIPQDKINLQNFPLSGKPFEIKTKNGVVRDLIVDKDVPTWEVNVLKSIVSQLQVDTQGENAKQSKHNQLPEGQQPYAMFKAMEDSVGGKCEVVYDISPLPEHILQNKPELVPMPELRENGDIISLVKTKNYSNCEQRVSYHFGLNGRNNWEPGSNDNGKYLSRSSLSHVVISGSLKRFTIQSSVTTNQVVLSPDQQDTQQGMVASKMNLTLHEVQDISQEMGSPSNPQSTGNLVYNYNNAFEGTTSRRPNVYEQNRKSNKRNENSDESKSDSSDSIQENNENNYLQPKPKLMEAPRNPMLAYFIGNKGNSIQADNKVDAVSAAKHLAQQIGNEMQKPDSMPEEETLEKFTILSRLIRTMNVEQIADIQRDLYEQPQSSNQLNQDKQGQRSRRAAWTTFRDAVAQAGTGPALVNIKQWIENQKIQGHEAANVVDAVAKSARVPTPEYVDAFFELAKSEETKKQHVLRDAAIISFADLIRHAVVNKRSAHNRYPVHAFGRLFSRSNNNVHEKYIPYMGEELKSAVESGDSKKIQLYVTALGRTAHPRILAVFEPYLEGKKEVSPYQRFLMVLSMYKLATSHPKVARSVLYKIYSNNADHYEIRTAAVYMLMKTNPPTSMMQRMADYTNYDSNKHVNSAVKSTIESLAAFESGESHELSNSAKAALPLLTSEKYGPQYSRVYFKNYKNSETHSGIAVEASYVGSDDSIIPKGVSVTITPTFKGLKIPKLQLGGSVSSVQDLWNFVEKKLEGHNKDNKRYQRAQEQKFSPENIAKMLGIRGEEPQQVEGFAFMTSKSGDNFVSFDNHSIERIPEQFKQLEESMKNGMDFEDTKLSSYEVTMSFPTETGYPFTYSLKAPSLMSIQGQGKMRSESDSKEESRIPKSASASGKARLVYGIKVQQRLSFVTPFEHQQYIAGIDKSLQVHVPVRSEVQYDKSKQEASFKLQPHDEEREFKIIQFKIQPFTSKYDILSFRPVPKDKNTHLIEKDNSSPSEVELNDHSNNSGLKFKWEEVNSKSSEENQERYDKTDRAMNAAFELARSVAAIYYPSGPTKAEYKNYFIKLSPNTDMSAEMKVSVDSLTTDSNNDGETSDNWSPNAKAPHLEKDLSERERKEQFLKKVSNNINSAQASAVDLSLTLNGGNMQSSLSFTAALGLSNVDSKSRALLYTRATTKDGKDYHLSAALESKTPNVESLDYEETLKANKPQEFDAEFHFGRGTSESTENSKNRVKIQAKVKLTEQRKNQIRASHDAQSCNKQKSQSGNKMTPACDRANERAASMDAGRVIITFENESTLKPVAMDTIDYVLHMSPEYSTMRKNHEERQEDNKIEVTFELSSDDDKVDLLIKTEEGKLDIKNIQLHHQNNEYNGKSRDSSDKQDPEYDMSPNSVCSLDKSQTKTFDDHIYSHNLGKCWHVAMTSYPKNDPDRPSQQQEIQEDMHVSILTRESENGQKDFKITLGDKEIELSASAPRQTQAKVNGQKVKYSKYESYQEKKNNEVLFDLFELADKSLKFVSDKYDVEVLYDGSRAEIKAGDRYRNSVRGLCGNNDAEPDNDQQTPRGCLIQKPEEFAASYAMTKDEQCQGPARENAEKAKNAPCTYESPRLGNVINDQEAGRKSQRNGKENSNEEEGLCTLHRTKVIKSETQICFSLRPVPTCSSSCRANNTKSKNINFHCVPRTSTSEKVAARIEEGANPDLSQKSVSRSEIQNIPISCSA